MRTIAALMILALAALAPAGSFAADEAKLDQLFVELKSAPTLEQGKAVEREIMQAWLESGDADIDRQMQDALTSMENGAFDEALSRLDAIIAAKPDYAEGWNKRATLHFLMGNYDASIADIAETLKREPRHFAALSGLGAVMLRLNDPAAALKAMKRAVEIDPNLDEVQATIRALEAQQQGQGA